MNQEPDQDSGGQTTDGNDTEPKLSNGHCPSNGHCRNNGQAEESRELSFAMIPGEKYQFTDQTTDGFLALTNYRLIIGHSTTNGTITTNGTLTNGIITTNGSLVSPSNCSSANGTTMNGSSTMVPSTMVPSTMVPSTMVPSTMVSGDKISLPLGTIDLIEPKGGSDITTLYILTKHVRSFKCTFESVEKCQKWYKLLNEALVSKSGEKNLFCFKFYEAGCKLLENSSVYYSLIQALKSQQKRTLSNSSNCLHGTMSDDDQIVTNFSNGIVTNGTLVNVSSGTVSSVSSGTVSSVSSGPLSNGSCVTMSTKEGSVSYAAMMSLSTSSLTSSTTSLSASSSRVSINGSNHNQSNNCPTSIIQSNGSIMNGSNGHCVNVMSMNGLSMSASNLSLYQLPFTNERDQQTRSDSYQPILMTTSMTTSTNSLTTSTTSSRDHPLHDSNSSEHPLNENQLGEHPLNENQLGEHPLDENQSSEHPLNENQSSEHPLNENQSSEHPLNENQSSEHPLNENQSSEHPLTDSNSRDHPLSDLNSRANPSNGNEISEDLLSDLNSRDDSLSENQVWSCNHNELGSNNVTCNHNELRSNNVTCNQSVIRVGFPCPQIQLSCDDYSRERIQSEYDRMDFGSIPGSWKISPINMKYKLCSTYPEYLIVPGKVKEEELIQVATFRSFHRIPTVVWRYKKNGCTISRSSQPEVGWLGWRSTHDENLIASIVSSCYNPVTFSSKKLLILDARSYAAAVANRAKGGGCECPEYYPCAEVSFMGLANIHSIRKSFQSIRYLCQYPVDPNR